MGSAIGTRSQWVLTGAVVALIAIVAVGGSILVTADDGGGPTAVTLVEQRNGQPPQITTFTSAAEAASAAEKASGAAIPLGSPPAGYRLVSLTILPMPPFPTSGLPTRIEARYEKGSEWFKLLYVGSRFQFPGDESPANRLPAPTAGQDLYRVTAGPLVEYTLLTADRGFIVTIPTPGPISEAEAIRILSSVTK